MTIEEFREKARAYCISVMDLPKGELDRVNANYIGFFEAGAEWALRFLERHNKI